VNAIRPRYWSGEKDRQNLANQGVTFVGVISETEHGLMVSEALIALKEPGALPAWIERYKLGRHREPVLGQRDEIALQQEASWRSALGGSPTGCSHFA